MDIRDQTHLQHPAAAGSLEDNDHVLSQSTSSPKLGDFSKLIFRPTPSHHKSIQTELKDVKCPNRLASVKGQFPETQHDDLQTRGPSLLGNFSKVFSHFESPVPRPTSDGDSHDRILEPLSISQSDSRERQRHQRKHANAATSAPSCSAPPLEVFTKDERPQVELMSEASLSALSETESAADFEVSELSSATTPSSSLGKQSGFPADHGNAPATTHAKLGTDDANARVLFDWNSPKVEKHSSSKSPTPSKQNNRQTVPTLSYQLFPGGPVHLIPNSARTAEAKHKALSASLVSHFVDDVIVGSLYPEVKANGIHVFLDLSNIQISLNQALKHRFSLNPNVRLKPLPRLNMEFLTEILVRQRNVRVLNAGCSMRPDRSEPCFISDLRKLNYHVDVRERIRVDGAKSPGPLPSKRTSSPEDVRYVEDLVDETLQIRIGESVMEYFEEQGTIVLATGDAKPAKYSDGFFTYAERALRMGWNVEVVSWNQSLSSAWKAPAWTTKWGQRFRLIELDEFLDDLWVL